MRLHYSIKTTAVIEAVRNCLHSQYPNLTSEDIVFFPNVNVDGEITEIFFGAHQIRLNRGTSHALIEILLDIPTTTSIVFEGCLGGIPTNFRKLSLLPALDRLSISFCPLTSFTFSHAELRYLDLNCNQLAKLALDLPRLRKLNLHNNALSEWSNIQWTSPNVKSIDLTGNALLNLKSLHGLTIEQIQIILRHHLSPDLLDFLNENLCEDINTFDFSKSKIRIGNKKEKTRDCYGQTNKYLPILAAFIHKHYVLSTDEITEKILQHLPVQPFDIARLFRELSCQVTEKIFNTINSQNPNYDQIKNFRLQDHSYRSALDLDQYHNTIMSKNEVPILETLEMLIGEPVPQVFHFADFGFEINHSHIESLYLNKRQLSDLPEALGKLTFLKFLWVEQNRLKMLPLVLGGLERLEQIWIEGNPLPQVLLDRNEKCKEVLSYWYGCVPEICTKILQNQPLNELDQAFNGYAQYSTIFLRECAKNPTQIAREVEKKVMDALTLKKRKKDRFDLLL